MTIMDLADLKPFRQKHSAKIALAIFGLAVLLAAWLLYQNYLKPSYELSQFLPPDFQISFELRRDRLTFPKIQQEKILKYPALAGLYEKAESALEPELKNWPLELQNAAKESTHGLLFFQSPDEYGLLLEISDRKQFKQLGELKITGWHQAMMKKNILTLTNSTALLEKITGQKGLKGQSAYLSLTIKPWLEMRLQNSFFEAKYQESILSGLQSILWPLGLSQNRYSLTLDSGSYALTLNLTPEQKAASYPAADLKPWLTYLLKEADLAVGLADSVELQKTLENNENLKQLWRDFDSHLWISSQLSLSSLFKQLKYPLLFSQKGSQWQILTVAENKDILEYYLKAYLAQFMPKETRKILPDGTWATELMADLSKIQWEAENINDWQVFSYGALNLGENQPGFALKDNLFIASNKIKQLNLNPLEINCNFRENGPINVFLMLKPRPKADQPLAETVSWLKLAENLKKFSTITAISSLDGEIKVCLGL